MSTHTFDRLANGALRLRPRFDIRVALRRALYLAVLLLPGTLIILPLLWWLDRGADIRQVAAIIARLSKRGHVARILRAQRRTSSASIISKEHAPDARLADA
jgi:hypothetical protein